MTTKSQAIKLAQIEALIESTKREFNYAYADRPLLRARLKNLDLRYMEVRNTVLKDRKVVA